MYKDKQKQNRRAQAKFKAKANLITAQNMNSIPGPIPIAKGITGIVEGYPDPVFTGLMAKAKPGLRRVSKPGDEDYVPM